MLHCDIIIYLFIVILLFIYIPLKLPYVERLYSTEGTLVGQMCIPLTLPITHRYMKSNWPL